MGRTIADRMTERMVDTAEVKPCSWNYRKMNDAMFAKERTSIETYGMLVPTLVRSGDERGPFEDGHLEIIDGEHRWRACMDLGRPVLVRDLGNVPDRTAKKLTIILNETHGEPKYDQLGALLSSLANDDVDDLIAEMPFSDFDLLALTSLPDMPQYSTPRAPDEPDEDDEPNPLEHDSTRRTVNTEHSCPNCGHIWAAAKKKA